MIQYHLVSRTGITSGSGRYRKPSKEHLVFLLITSPTNAEIKKLVRDFRIEKKLFESYTKIAYAMRSSTKPFSFAMRDFFVEKNQTKSSNLLFIITNKCLIIVSSRDSPYYHMLFQDVKEKLSSVKVRSVGHMLYYFLQEDVEDNYQVLAKTEEAITDIEKQVSHYEKDVQIDVDRIIHLKRRLFRISRDMWASTKIISSLRTGSAQVKLNGEERSLLGDIYDTFIHQIDVVSAQKDMLSDALSVYSTNISNRLAKTSNELNQIMKKLAAFALILMIPTLIASIYGMNFRYLPFAALPSGFFFTMAAMMSSSVIIALLLRTKKWL